MDCKNFAVTKCVLFVVTMALIIGKTSGNRIPSFAGPYRVYVRSVNNDTDEFHSTGKLWGRFYVSHPKPKEMQYFRGTLHFGVEIDNDMKSEVRISKRSNNQWKRNAFVMHFPHACSATLLHARSLVEPMYGISGLKCPLPKIIRELKNQSVEINFPHFPIMPYDRYLFTWALVKGTETVGVTVIDADVVPKV